MIRTFMRLSACIVLLCLVFAANSKMAGAHERREVAGHQIVVGWNDEPAFAGFKNAVSFRVTQGGKGVEGLQMKVEVIFGEKESNEKTEAVEVRPAFGDPGHYTSAIIPNRPGKYTFHITGQLGGEAFDQFFTSGEQTFDDIGEPKEIQFPAKDPSTGELAELSNRLTSRVDDAGTKAETATDKASITQNLSYGGIGLGALALILSVLSLIRSRRRP